MVCVHGFLTIVVNYASIGFVGGAEKPYRSLTLTYLQGKLRFPLTPSCFVRILLTLNFSPITNETTNSFHNCSHALLQLSCFVWVWFLELVRAVHAVIFIIIFRCHLFQFSIQLRSFSLFCTFLFLCSQHINFIL